MSNGNRLDGHSKKKTLTSASYTKMMLEACPIKCPMTICKENPEEDGRAFESLFIEKCFRWITANTSSPLIFGTQMSKILLTIALQPLKHHMDEKELYNSLRNVVLQIFVRPKFPIHISHSKGFGNYVSARV